MTDERIYIGSVESPTLVFNNTNIEEILCNNAVDLIGDELSSDTLEVSVFYDDVGGIFSGQLYGTPIFYYTDNVFVGKYYINKVDRTNVRKYQIYATSLIGLVAKEEFYGGFYTGQTFREVATDILITNGLDLTKYYLYEPVGVQYGSGGGLNPSGVQVLFNENSTNYWKYKLHIDFVFLDRYGTSTTSDEIAGGGGYFVSLTVSSTKRLTISFFYNYNFQAKLRLASDKIGIGSRIVVDINPLAGTAYIGAYYINPDDPSDTGLLEARTSIEVPTGASSSNMNYAYGMGTGSLYSYPFKLNWKEYKVWDENGVLILNAAFATNTAGTKNYVLNKSNGYYVEDNHYNGYGSSLGMVGDLSRSDRDAELTSSITYGNGVDNLTIFGWIQNGTRRDALHQLLFSQNVSLLKSDEGLLFTTISSNTAGSINEEDIYDDSGESSMTVAKKISITEHTYETAGVTSQTIYDNSNSTLIEGQYIAIFDKAPIFGTPTGSGITILFSNCNAAIVTGRGTISGTPYTHSKNVITYINGDSSDGTDISVNDVGLITSMNSDYIMNKLKAYYNGRLKKITNGIKYHGEKCGLKYLFKTLYSDTNNAYLVKFNARTSSFLKAACDFVAGYVPSTGSGYTGYKISTYGETWSVPDSVRAREYPTLRFNIIGKGHDGTNGTNGTSGSNATQGSGHQPGGAGGSGGTHGVGGAGGYIYSVTIDASNVYFVSVSQNSYQTTVRTYNSGGTQISSYSSGSGNPSENGFLNVFDGLYYARPGIDGMDGAAGGKGGTAWRVNQTSIDIEEPESGGDVDTYSGGYSFHVEADTDWSGGTNYYYYSSYGGGGGAAYGRNGGNARVVSRSGAIVNTAGGNGANALTPQNPYQEYGSGGFGGHGGGGGGGAGTLYEWPNVAEFNSGYTRTQAAGTGGTGSAGTSGKDGCVIIYY